MALQKELYGRGPTQAKSYFQDDRVVCVLRGGFTRVEETLLEGGRGAAVLEQRRAFQILMRDRYEAVVERAATAAGDEAAGLITRAFRLLRGRSRRADPCGPLPIARGIATRRSAFRHGGRGASGPPHRRGCGPRGCVAEASAVTQDLLGRLRSADADR